MNSNRILFHSLILTFCFLIMPLGRAWAVPEKYEKMAAALKFTPEQREKLQKIQDEYHKTLPGKHQAMDQARQELELALKSEKSNEEVQKKFDEVQKKQDDFAQARFEKILAIRSILTPEQRQLFNVCDDKSPAEAEKKTQ